MSVYKHLSFLIILEDSLFFLYLAGICNALFFILSSMSTGKQKKETKPKQTHTKTQTKQQQTKQQQAKQQQKTPALNGIMYV